MGCSFKMKYQFYEDPGHGWLKVKIADLEKLGIADKISGYSYMRNDYAYLEEDCDVTLFMDALEAKENRKIAFDEIATTHLADKTSKIRSYDGYRHLTEEEKKMAEIIKNKMLTKENWSEKALSKIKNASLDTLLY